MTSEDILSVANAAKVANYFDGYVNWCKAALKTAKVKRSFLIISPLKFLALSPENFVTFLYAGIEDSDFPLLHKQKNVAVASSIVDIYKFKSAKSIRI